ncbi:MAG: transcriptional regulator [Brevinematales bacterium]|jgi:DNA-binding MarR family transcriptional regulator
MNSFKITDLNEIFQARARIGIMTILISSGDTDFTDIKEQAGLTGGNLGAHIRVLEDAGYIEVIKGYAGRRPRTTCRVTQRGRETFLKYLTQMEEILKNLKPES